jgi:potassium/chloride transporter 9
MSANQEREHLAHIIDSTVGRPGIYNPHDESHFDRRRTSSGTFAEVPRRPAISILSKMGINAGMHTHHLHEEVLQESDPESDSSSDNGDMDEFQHRDSKRTGSGDPTKQPLLSSLGRGRRRSGSNASSANSGGTVRGNERAERPTLPTAYGTMSTSHSVIERTAQDGKNVEEFPPFHPRTTPKLPPAETPRTQSTSPVRHSGTQTPRDARPAPLRPGMSRQSSAMRFSSRPVPETTVTVEDEGSKISFAPSRPESSRPERPPHSRQSSYGKFSSRPMPETKITGSGEEPRTISFAETPVQQSQSAAHSRHHSRQNSQYSQFGQSDLNLSVSEVSGSYRMASGEEDAPETGSPYSTQGLALSFNDLPSRAQHLILNELMRQNSRDTAVIMSTLPIPAEGTSHDNAATVQYLSDVEVLCNELPPTLMVLSNNMTVTVSI